MDTDATTTEAVEPEMDENGNPVVKPEMPVEGEDAPAAE